MKVGCEDKPEGKGSIDKNVQDPNSGEKKEEVHLEHESSSYPVIDFRTRLTLGLFPGSYLAYGSLNTVIILLCTFGILLINY